MSTVAHSRSVTDQSLKKFYSLLDELEAVQFLTRAPLALRKQAGPFVRAAIAYSNGADDENSVAPHVPAATAALAQYRDMITSGEIVLGAYTPRTEWDRELSHRWQTIYRQLAAPDRSTSPKLAKAGSPSRRKVDGIEAVPPPLSNVTESEPSHVLSPAVPTWGAGIEWLVPGSLSDHRVWRDLIGFDTPEREQELIDSVRSLRVVDPIIVTGDGCASPPETILTGHRRRRAAMDARIERVPVIRRYDLTADAEEEIIIKAAIASTHVRRLAPSKVYALEERLHTLYARRGQGFRSDLTSVATNGSSTMVGDTLMLVASETGATRNSVANRRKVFGSPVASRKLREAVDEGKLSLTAAAALVREVESDDTIGDAIRDPDSHSEHLERARQDVDTRLQEKLGQPRSRPQKAAVKTPRPKAYQLPLDGTPVQQRVGGRVVVRRVVGVTATHVVIEETEQRPVRDAEPVIREGEGTAAIEPTMMPTPEGHPAGSSRSQHGGV